MTGVGREARGGPATRLQAVVSRRRLVACTVSTRSQAGSWSSSTSRSSTEDPRVPARRRLLPRAGRRAPAHRPGRGGPARHDRRAAGIAAAVRGALPDGAQLLGFTPESFGVAVRRALSRASSWLDTRLGGHPRGAVSPNEHLALDQVLTEEVGAGRRGPTLRIWEWDESAVVIGSFQSLRNEVDPEGAAKYGVQVVRRISGGGAMFMEAGAIISYSLYVPADLVQGMTFADSYAYLDEWVIEALKSLGIDAYYQPLNDITSAKGKIGGAAQKRLGTVPCCTTRHELRHGRPEDGRGAPDRPREDERQGHDLGGEAGRPPASQTGLSRRRSSTGSSTRSRSGTGRTRGT